MLFLAVTFTREEKKIRFVFISFIRLPILKPLARMTHIYISHHIILRCSSAATCLVLLNIRVCWHQTWQFAAIFKDYLPQWQCP